MSTKPSSYYQREYRRRLREQGLIKKEVWISPENTGLLAGVEKQLRELATDSGKMKSSLGDVMTVDIDRWTTETLYKSLESSPLNDGDPCALELVEGVDPSIVITIHQYGDLPIYLTVSGEQIIAESILWPASEVKDLQAFNDNVLRTHKYFPLSTISLDRMADGSEYYQMFGALSSESSLDNILSEIDMLANNVIQATSAYSDYLAESE